MAQRGRTRRILILLVATSITLLTLDFRGSGSTDSVRDGAGGIVAPVGGFFDWVLGPAEATWNGAFDYDDVVAENEELKTRLASIVANELIISALERERDELREMLGLEAHMDLPLVAARIVRTSPTNFKPTWEIDRGSDHGVKVGHPVIVGNGLIGRVSKVRASSSELQLLVDPNFSVGVRLSRSGEVGIASGNGRGQLLEVGLLAGDVAIVPGETLSTSGLEGSSYPPDLVVGTAVVATLNVNEGTQSLTMAPAVNLDQVSLVAVLLWEPSVLSDSPPEAR